MTRARATRRGVPGRHRLVARLSDSRGSAIVEFVGLGVLLLVPTLYLVLTLGRVQAAAFAADSIAREGARIVSVQADPGAADAAVRAQTRLILDDSGFVDVPTEAVLALRCTSTPCRTPGSVVAVTATIPVGPPGIGHSLFGGDRLAVKVRTSQRLIVDPFIARNPAS